MTTQFVTNPLIEHDAGKEVKWNALEGLLQCNCHTFLGDLKILALIVRYGGIDGAHHKAWVLDQITRIICGTPENYDKLVAWAKDGEDGPDTYDWETGVAP